MGNQIRCGLHAQRVVRWLAQGTLCFFWAFVWSAKAQSPATQPQAGASAVGERTKVQFNLTFSHREAPNYPEMMLRRHVEARVFSEVTVNADCSIGEVRHLGAEVSEGTISSPFTDAVNRAVKEWRPVCTGMPARGVRVLQEFVFGAGSNLMTRYKWLGKTVEVTQALALMEPPYETNAPIDTRTLDCPLLVKVRMLMPHSPNRVTGFPNDGHPLDVWLKGLTFQRQYRLHLIGERIAIHIPCSIIDIH